MNRIKKTFKEKKNILTIYITAGYPELDSMEKTILRLEKHGVDIIEIGLPFSDPLADGPVIQQSSKTALQNGMNTDLLFQQLSTIREKTQIPLLIMCYANSVLKYGFEKFCSQASRCGIDGLIIPDLPFEMCAEKYLPVSRNYRLEMVFMISPDTSESRIRKMDEASDSFLYVLSSNSTTGKRTGFSENQKLYFERIKKMKLKNPIQIGFGISDAEAFREACEYASGAIVGSAFIKSLYENDKKNDFITSLRQTPCSI
ncbi:MAG: tryptophan synthase subunit alpha [Bacteroidota bacterium]